MADEMRSIRTPEAIIERGEPLTRWCVRTHPDDRTSWEAAYGIALPGEPLRASSSATASALWLGPDEWLVLMPPREARAFQERCESAAKGHAPPTSIVDISHRQIGITLSGPRIPWVLNAGCPLDLSDDAFPIGTCTRTLFGKAEIVLWRREAALWHVECWRSFAPYTFAYLSHAAAEARL